MNTLGVRLDSNGKYWQATWTSSTGKRQRKSLGAKAKLSRREALGLCRELAAQHIVKPGSKDAARAPSLGAWLERHDTLTSELAETTRALYTTTGQYLREFFGEGCRLDRINRASAADFRLWLGKLKTPQRPDADGNPTPISEATVRTHLARAKQIMERAMREDVLTVNPFDREVTKCPPMEHDWRYVTAEELAKLLEAAPSPAWRRLLALCRLAGLRRSEALALTSDCLDGSKRVLTVKPRRGKRTTKERTRTVPICPELWAELKGLDPAAAEPVCPISRNNVERALEAIIRRAGLEPWGKPLHTLRKNLVTDWVTKHPVMDVASWLGHDVKVAAEHYHQTRPETIAAVTGARTLKLAKEDAA